MYLQYYKMISAMSFASMAPYSIPKTVFYFLALGRRKSFQRIQRYFRARIVISSSCSLSSSAPATFSACTSPTSSSRRTPTSTARWSSYYSAPSPSSGSPSTYTGHSHCARTKTPRGTTPRGNSSLAILATTLVKVPHLWINEACCPINRNV